MINIFNYEKGEWKILLPIFLFIVLMFGGNYFLGKALEGHVEDPRGVSMLIVFGGFFLIKEYVQWKERRARKGKV